MTNADDQTDAWWACGGIGGAVALGTDVVVGSARCPAIRLDRAPDGVIAAETS